MKKIITLLIIVLGPAMLLAQSTIVSSAISFKIKNLGINTNGTFGGLQANIRFNPSSPDAGLIEASIPVSTLSTDNSMRDEHLRKEEFFDLEHYPKITLRSTALKHKSGNNYLGKFDLTIKGKTKPVDIPFSYADKGNTAVFNGTFQINRRDFDIGGSTFTMSDTVFITIQAEVAKP